MAIPATNNPTSLCRLCEQRLPDTKVYYDEVMSSRTTLTRVTRRRSRYSTNSLTSYGNMMLCAPCASQYANSVSIRKNGRRLMNWGIILMIVGVFLFAVTLAAVQDSPLELVAAAPILIGIVLLGTGLGMSVMGNRLKQPMIRYLLAQLKK